MRRPLFMAALFLVMIAALRLKTGRADELQEGCIRAGTLEADSQVVITGQVYQKDESNIYLKSVFYAGSNAFGQSAADSQQFVPIQENIICDMEDAPGIPLGSMVAVQGTFMPYSRATNPGEFDASVYYRTLEIGGKVRKAVLLAAGEGTWLIRERLYRLKECLKERLYRIFPEKEAAVMSALLLGDKSELDGELKDLYKRNGILHILSISSLHITIIGMSIYRLLRRTGLPTGVCAAGGSVILLLYGCMTGFSVSACRAIGMYLIKMLAEVAGRTYDMLTALGLMGALMVLRNPFYLENSGFLLSFTSVLGIGVVYPALMPPLPDGRERGKQKGRIPGQVLKGLLASLFASLSITLTTLPVQLWFYYEIPLYSVFLNLFVIPFLKPMMITGLLAMLVPGLGILGMVDRLILNGYEFLCSCFDGLPFHTWNPGCPKIWQICVYYLILAGVVLLRQLIEYMENNAGSMDAAAGSRRGKKGAGMIGGYAGMFFGVLLFVLRPPAKNSVTFLDVGQGDGILVRTASGQNYLFDCGSSSRKNIGKYVLIPYLKYNGIRTIDSVFLSHPDADHVNGAEELFALGGDNHITVRQLLLPDIEEGAREEQLGGLLEAAAGADQKTPVAIGYLAAGDSWDSGSAVFTCLHPEKGFPAGDVNAYSECFLVEFYENVSENAAGSGEPAWTLLLTGDVQEKGEESFCQEIDQRGIGEITVLKAAHHGSRNSTPEELLDRLSPLLTVISSGRNNRYGHPHAELLGRLEACGTYIMQTAQSGAVTVSCDEEGVVIHSFLR
ncbi:MAG: DNA internalization-related competence protein ComEC/Rec2 [Lachnospiraceae bacterium]|jgi:competence protein ComEC|nr:DNA internalization-related competence protein ComEC/Rec2 [Lachnospiraceae bacterium]